MEINSFIILVAYNLLFFWKFWKNPYLNHTSEMASTFYPHWQSRKFIDNIYYKYPFAIPFLSTMYLPHLLTSFTKSFRVLQYNILIHYVLGSYLAYILFSQWCR